MKWDRERYLAHMNFEYTGREMFSELFGPLLGLPGEWRMQGASEDEINMIAYDWDYVPYDLYACSCGAVTGIQPTVTQEDDDIMLGTDSLGRHIKLCKKSATIPLPLDFPVKTMDDWLKIRHWYRFSEERIHTEQLQQQKILHDSGTLLLFQVPGGFDEPRELLGDVGACIACYEEPELITDILDTIGDMVVRVMERVGSVMPIDAVAIHEDMAGKAGPLFGPNQVRQFMKPYYNKIWDCARSFGARCFSQDSDGDMSVLVEPMIECGVTCMFPCEPASGMDMKQLREKYGSRMAFKGGIDKFALMRGPEAIRRELEYKLSGPLRGGGTVFGLDHRIPNGVPLENYRYYVNLGREMLGLEPVSGKGWGRMAF